MHGWWIKFWMCFILCAIWCIMAIFSMAPLFSVCSLDTFPYAGTTTTCESLYMGVPCVTMGGAVHAHNVGVSLLSKVGERPFQPLMSFKIVVGVGIMYILLLMLTWSKIGKNLTAILNKRLEMEPWYALYCRYTHGYTNQYHFPLFYLFFKLLFWVWFHVAS